MTDCDGTYECSSGEHAGGCLSAELDPPTELLHRDALDCPRDRCGPPRCVECPLAEPW